MECDNDGKEMAMTISSRHGVQVGVVVVSAFAMLMTMGGGLSAQTAGNAGSSPQVPACPGDNGGLALSPGFCATVFADNLGHVRQLAAAPDGTLYANTWRGRYFKSAP